MGGVTTSFGTIGSPGALAPTLPRAGGAMEGAYSFLGKAMGSASRAMGAAESIFNLGGDEDDPFLLTQPRAPEISLRRCACAVPHTWASTRS